MPSINFVDLFLLLLVLIGIWSGWRQGFLAGATGLLLLAASVAAALWGYAPLAQWLQEQGWITGIWPAPVALVAILLGSRILLGVLADAILGRIPERVHRHGANRLLGLLPGAGSGLLHAAIAALLLLTLPLSDGVTRHAQESQLASRLAEPAEWLETQLTPVFDPVVQRSLSRMTVPAESAQRVDLPFRVAEARIRPELEAEMLVLLNQERATAGLRPLQADPEATVVARAHSRDMFARGYFSHIGPEGQTPFDRMRAARVRFLAAGENLALARTLPMAHQGLMQSPGHRANILRPAFGRVGIGIVDGGRHGLMVTQAFRN